MTQRCCAGEILLQQALRTKGFKQLLYALAAPCLPPVGRLATHRCKRLREDPFVDLIADERSQPHSGFLLCGQRLIGSPKDLPIMLKSWPNLCR